MSRLVSIRRAGIREKLYLIYASGLDLSGYKKVDADYAPNTDRVYWLEPDGQSRFSSHLARVSTEASMTIERLRERMLDDEIKELVTFLEQEKN